MTEKLKELKKRYDELREAAADPALYGDPARSREVLREQKKLRPIMTIYEKYLAAEKDLREAEELLSEKPDPELRELAAAEKADAEERIRQLSDALRVELLPRDENDDKNVILEIRAGAGGEEAALFAAVLFRMYGMYADLKGWKFERLNATETELGGFREVSARIEADGAYSRLKYESGVHRGQRVPDTESQGRIQTSTVTVAVLPEADEVDVEINEKDLQIDTYRSSGAGGQHVNKTESAIRITHLPTGIVVECQDERSQYKNRDRAMKILRARLYEAELERQTEARDSVRRSQVGSGERSERIRTYNYPQGRVSDHRIGLTLHKLESVLNGNLDEIVDALVAADQAEKLAAYGNNE